ncbi:MAG: hypothetical protein ACFFBD_11740, partial [Candidatus Hodarchaeota archaeon]
MESTVTAVEEEIIQFILATWEKMWQEIKKGEIKKKEFSALKKLSQEAARAFVQKFEHLPLIYITKKQEIIIRTTDEWVILFPTSFLWSELCCEGQLFPIVQPLVESIKDLNKFCAIFHQKRSQITATLTKTDKEILEQILQYSSIKFTGLVSQLSKDLQRSWRWTNIRLKRLLLGGVILFRARINYARLGLTSIVCRFPRSYQPSLVEQQYRTYHQVFRGERIAFLIIPKYSKWWTTKSAQNPVYHITRLESLLNLDQREKYKWNTPPDFNHQSKQNRWFLDYTGE